jgi:toxin ParE1/3/4
MRGTSENRRSVIWSPEAFADLEEIWTYYAGVAGRQTADNMARRISDACRVLDEHPLAGRARDELRLGIRSFTTRPHVIFYRLIAGIPEIVRVLDGRRDIDAIFADE